jgi:K+-sensing histidine kinase KdpD
MMSKSTLKTDFASAERESREVIVQDAQRVLLHPDVKVVLDIMPQIVFVLNSCRQIVYANTEALIELGTDSVSRLYGARPGEALNCVHCTETSGGCGTTMSCRECGAVLAILDSLRGLESKRECMILSKTGSMFNLKIKASPVQLDRKDYVIVSALDISDDKWRMVMERTFFHDVMNIVGALQGVADLIYEMVPDELDEVKKLSKVMVQGTRNIIDEMQKQKEIISAENHEMSVDFKPVQSIAIIQDTVKVYRHHSLAKDRHIVIDENSVDKSFRGDSRLLSRILGNMVKNALEATKPDTCVSIGCKVIDKMIRFYVHNENIIPESVQHQIFLRSFSTKGRGRGIGTYSIKLFTEQYLNGRAWFTSVPGEGTTFFVEFPI